MWMQLLYHHQCSNPRTKIVTINAWTTPWLQNGVHIIKVLFLVVRKGSQLLLWWPEFLAFHEYKTPAKTTNMPKLCIETHFSWSGWPPQENKEQAKKMVKKNAENLPERVDYPTTHLRCIAPKETHLQKGSNTQYSLHVCTPRFSHCSIS
jgi:hypothetical protein